MAQPATRGRKNLQRLLVPVITVLGISLLCSKTALAQCPGQPDSGIVANPNRPTVADPADITQFGVLEVEYGFDHVIDRGAGHENNLVGLFKFAATCKLEIRWGTDSLLRQTSGDKTVTGLGDNRIGFQYRFHRQSRATPTLAFSYALKLPSASVAKGLGTGKYDHQLKFLASKDILGVHFDFNTSYFFLGRPVGGGTDQNAEMNLAFSHPIYKKLQFTGEFYGDTQFNTGAPATANGLWAFTYEVTPRLIVDAGIDHGLTASTPFNCRFFVGVTYSIADLYHLGRRARH